MERVEKTIFISYRRTNASWALAIFQNLTNHGYDVFLDYTGIASGDFERVIIENIRARAHFLVLLTPSALERCGEPNDWLRREIETALDNQRNIVPLVLENFDFDAPAIANQLTEKLDVLKRYNALRVPAEYFMEAMDRLREKYLNLALTAVIHPASITAQEAARKDQAAATAASIVEKNELTAQHWFERGLAATDPDEKLRCNSEAIRLQPDYADAYCNRGMIRKENGDLDGALHDVDEAIRLQPDDAEAYFCRGLIRVKKGDFDGALHDYSETIRLKPDHARAYVNRGIARSAECDLEGALRDNNEAIRLWPDFAEAYFRRGVIRRGKGDLEGALRDCNEALRLGLDSRAAYKFAEQLQQEATEARFR